VCGSVGGVSMWVVYVWVGLGGGMLCMCCMGVCDTCMFVC